MFISHRNYLWRENVFAIYCEVTKQFLSCDKNLFFCNNNFVSYRKKKVFVTRNKLLWSEKRFVSIKKSFSWHQKPFLCVILSGNWSSSGDIASRFSASNLRGGSCYVDRSFLGTSNWKKKSYKSILFTIHASTLNIKKLDICWSVSAYS